MDTFIISLALLVGFYVAWNIGANDVSNAMGTSVGSKTLSLRQAVVIAGVLEFCGAFFFGSNVSSTLQGGILSQRLFEDQPKLLVLGMLASLLATGFWLQIASYRGWPVSTTHSIIGAIVGAGLSIGGMQDIAWGQVASISTSWVLSPILGAVAAYALFSVIKKKIFYSLNPVQSALLWTPFITFFVCHVLSLVILIKGLSHAEWQLTLPEKYGLSLIISLIAGFISYLAHRGKKGMVETNQEAVDPQVFKELEKARGHLLQSQRRSQNPEFLEQINQLQEQLEQLALDVSQKVQRQFCNREYEQVEELFRPLQIMTACTMAFAHGANDVANAIGPLAVILSIESPDSPFLRFNLLALGGVGIVIGLATWGWRVIETVGKKITELTASRGFAAEFGASLTTLVASALGFPISTTHTLVGAVLGVGMARGFGAVNLRTIRDIAISWMVTIPAGAVLAIIFYHLLKVWLMPS
ncbi:MAG: hypothetical protein K0S07_1585 [Chlamydiales bacterium]|jgi:PiT family inorganic phosphate transporter|nr:hypothetical protein [Chlamydiales bacterium]